MYKKDICLFPKRETLLVLIQGKEEFIQAQGKRFQNSNYEYGQTS